MGSDGIQLRRKEGGVGGGRRLVIGRWELTRWKKKEILELTEAEAQGKSWFIGQAAGRSSWGATVASPVPGPVKGPWSLEPGRRDAACGRTKRRISRREVH